MPYPLSLTVFPAKPLPATSTMVLFVTLQLAAVLVEPKAIPFAPQALVVLILLMMFLLMVTSVVRKPREIPLVNVPVVPPPLLNPEIVLPEILRFADTPTFEVRIIPIGAAAPVPVYPNVLIVLLVAVELIVPVANHIPASFSRFTASKFPIKLLRRFPLS